jgi:HK97 family phage portal protein
MGLLSFFDRFRGPGASSGDRSPYGEFWFEPVSARTGSGMRVSPDSALRLAAVYACVRILAETMASLPLVIYQRRPDGGKDKVTDHWLYRLMAKRPNRFQNPFEWREMLQGHLALRGNAYNQIITNPRGEIIELMPIHPDRVKIELLPSGEYRYRVTDRFGAVGILPRGEVWHLRGLSSDGLMGMSPIELARENLGMALAAQDYGARFFANDAKPTGGWIEFPGSFKDSEAKKVFRESYQQAQSGANRGKVLVLENGMKFHEVGVTNKDAQFLELRKFQITDIARLFRVPPHMIADLERATFSNIEQQSLEFVMHTMTPWAERWEASIESELLLESDDIEIEFDFANLMRGDAASRSSYYQSGIQNGWLTRNEARVAENLNPLDGLDQPLRPLNMVEEDAAEDLELNAQAGAQAETQAGAQAKVAEPPAQEKTELPMDASKARFNGGLNVRFNALVQTTSERLARRISRSGHVVDKDILLISQALAVPLDRVQLWAKSQVAEPIDQKRLTQSLVSLGLNL